MTSVETTVASSFVTASAARSQKISAYNGPVRNSQGANPPSNGQRRTKGRKATASQVRALDAIGNRLQLNIEHWLLEKHGIRLASELSIADASAAIDELNSTTSGNGANH